MKDAHGLTATDRVLTYLFSHGPADCFSVGAAAFPDRDRVRVANGGGGDYAAQMFLGRLKKRGLVRLASSVGSSRWQLTAAGEKRVHEVWRK